MTTSRALPAARSKVRLLVALLLALTLVVTALPLAQRAAADTPLFFSEYVSGSGNNKALEIHNPNSTAVSLSGHWVEVWIGGLPSTPIFIPLIGVVPANGVWVVAHDDADPALKDLADQTHGGTWFDGDDLVVLVRSGLGLDRIGQLQADELAEPGPWGSGDTSTANNTLRRKATVSTGDAGFFSPFDPAVQWVGAGLDVFDGLGCFGETACATPEPPLVDCGPDLAIAAGAGGSRTVTAMTVSGTVADINVSSVAPADPGTIARTSFMAAAGDDPASATITIGADTPVGTYAVEVTAATDHDPAQASSCTFVLTVTANDAATALDQLRHRVTELRDEGLIETGTAERLLRRVDRATAALNAGGGGAAHGQLVAFAATLHGLQGRGLVDPAAAAALSTAVQDLLALLD
jgi:uncharacterized protein